MQSPVQDGERTELLPWNVLKVYFTRIIRKKLYAVEKPVLTVTKEVSFSGPPARTPPSSVEWKSRSQNSNSDLLDDPTVASTTWRPRGDHRMVLLVRDGKVSEKKRREAKRANMSVRSRNPN